MFRYRWNLSLILCSILYWSTFSACTETQAEEKQTGLVEQIKSETILISGSKPAVLNNEQLRCRLFFVRHAEKDSVGNDPALLPAGEARAERLAQIFKELPLRRIYSTNYQRTQLTAAPTAAAKHLKTQTYSPKDQNELLDQLITRSETGNYLIVGHSNSTPKMLNHLSGKTVYQSISEKIYYKLYVASIYQNGQVDILELKY